MKGSIKTAVIIIVVVIILFVMAGYIFLKSAGKEPSNSTDTTAVPTLAIPVKDFAPGVPMSQKTTILIQTSDSSELKYIVPTSQVDTYVKSLPEGYHVISKSP